MRNLDKATVSLESRRILFEGPNQLEPKDNGHPLDYGATMLSSSNKEQTRRHAIHGIHGIQQSNGKHYDRKGVFCRNGERNFLHTRRKENAKSFSYNIRLETNSILRINRVDATPFSMDEEKRKFKNEHSKSNF